MRRKTILHFALLLICIAAVFACLCGCGAQVRVEFSVDEITLSVGESRDLFPYARFTPATVKNKSFELISDSECVATDGTVVRAVSVGSAVVSSGDAKLKVTVKYRNVGSLAIGIDGDTVQCVDKTSDIKTIKFSVALDERCDPDTQITWYINGDEVKRGSAYECEPDRIGEYIVTASAGGVSSSQSVKIYTSTAAFGTYAGELEQSCSFTPVRFTAYESIYANNPRSVYEWRVNDEIKSDTAVFDFTPNLAGEYSVSLSVNGVMREINGQKSVTVTAVGDRAPKPCGVDFDDTDGVYIKWADGENIDGITVSIGGKRETYNRTDSRYSGRFSRGSFNATGIVSVCANAPDSYDIRLIADGRGESYSFMQYPEEARRFMDSRVLSRNNFLSSSEQAAIWVYELYATGEHEDSAYIARDVSNVEETVIATANALGIAAETEIKGSIISIKLGSYNNEPTSIATSGIAQLPAFLPHIEYDEKQLRNSKTYVFALDRMAKSVDVESSEQLLAAALLGCKPNPEKDSVASKVYARAKNALLSIIGADYDAERKIHAIYDWLQWCTRKAASDKSSVDFLEGVFISPVEERKPLGSVSSLGAAKAFALLCSIEGIECRINSYGNDSDEYYNRVRLDGLWYNVDVYGAEITLGGGGTTLREMCSHSMLLVTDEQLGVENAERAYDQSKWYYIVKRPFYDYLITKADGKTDIQTAVFDCLSAVKDTVPVYSVHGKEYISVTAVGLEFALFDGVNADSAVAEITAAIKAYYKEYGANLSVTVHNDRGILHIAVAIPRT